MLQTVVHTVDAVSLLTVLLHLRVRISLLITYSFACYRIKGIMPEQ